MLRARESGFLVWTPSRPEAWRRAYAYCEARGWQIDWWRDRPGAPLEEALNVHSRRSVVLARHHVMRGQHEPLPDEQVAGLSDVLCEVVVTDTAV
jgi:hypothetical protein